MKNEQPTAKFEKLTIPTYKVGECEKLPMFFEKKPYQGASGKLYPLPFTSKISDSKTDVKYDAAILENEYIRIEVLPEIGGKIQRALDKTTGYDFVYHNKVIKPAMVGLAGPWVSGGIEFNWPQHHRPTTFMPLEAKITNGENGEKTVWVGETDPMLRMRGMAGITITPGRSYIKAKVRLYNRTETPKPFMWWANLAVEINENYRTVFPPDVEWVNDHDRRAILEWPIAKGVYNTARPFDFGKGTDIHNVDAVKVPSSYLVSKGKCDYDFISGYDTGRDCGIVTVTDHHISPGKKMWHWGNHKFGAKWCANLTDDGSRYIELMTGVYTDNQPDFTWIMPFETKVFDQYWYPVREIGEVKNATVDGAVNVEMRDGKLFVGFNATGDFHGAIVRVKCGDKVIAEDVADISPEKVYKKSFEGKFDFEKVTATLEYDGKVLVGYKYCKRGNKKPIEPRKPALPPKEIKTVEELYLNGRHLEQYKHFAYEPEDYYKEALRRDAGDSRTNTALGNIYLYRGEFEKAIEYYDRAIERLTLRNDNPYETEAFYHKGLALKYLGKFDLAYDMFFRSVWSYNYASAGYYELALIDIRRGETAAAVEKLDTAISTNEMFFDAIRMKALLCGGDADKKLAELDPLCNVKTAKNEYFIDRAVEYMNAGMNDKAESVLLTADMKNPMTLYYLAYITRDRKKLKVADSLPWACVFSARLEDIAVLSFADTEMSNYYLGCLYYDRRRYDDAVACFEKCVAKKEFGPAYRNLAIAYFDKKHNAKAAVAAMTKAIELMPDTDRVFYELIQLYKNSNKPLSARLALHKKYSDLSASRDDCTLDKSIILCEMGKYDEAKKILLEHSFHTYEGGEGNLTRHHAWLHALAGNELIRQGRYDEAISELLDGFEFPLCYGEEKNYFAQESHLNYLLYVAYEKSGKKAKAKAALKAAITDHASPTEISYFRVLAYKKLGMKKEADALSAEMIKLGEDCIKNKSVLPYYGVGSPCPCPFEYDFEKRNTVKGELLVAFGKAARGDMRAARAAAQSAHKLDKTNFAAYAFDVFCN